MKFNSYDENDLKRLKNILKSTLDKNTVIVCIGTNREIADSLAPFVGMILEENNCKYKVFGTINNPVHALNLEKIKKEIELKYKDSLILAIDAGLDNQSNSVGKIVLEYEPMKPGIGVKKELPSIGNLSIMGVVGGAEELYNGDIRLDIIIHMAKAIAYSIL